ncbi:hypothetical protein KBT16_28455 [Nostoc sp. CCCryo 231-06]|nr:hypothetical protein [Nostoc sp. CCCryo 231-06]
MKLDIALNKLLLLSTFGTITLPQVGIGSISLPRGIIKFYFFCRPINIATRRFNSLNCISSKSVPVAPPRCRIARYKALGRKEFYWYYKLHATTPIFPTRNDGKLSKYKDLGKAGSQGYIDAVEQITARTKIEALDRSIEALKQGLKDLVEETPPNIIKKRQVVRDNLSRTTCLFHIP